LWTWINKNEAIIVFFGKTGYEETIGGRLWGNEVAFRKNLSLFAYPA